MFGNGEVEAANEARTANDGGPAKTSVREMVVRRDGKDAVLVV